MNNYEKQEKLLNELSQQLKTSQFNKVCKAIELEYKITEQSYERN